MIFNKTIVSVLTVLLMLNNVLPVSAVDGKKRTIYQRNSESDVRSDDSLDDSKDSDYVESEMEDEFDADIDSFSSGKNSRIPTKRRRLFSSRQTKRKSVYQVFDETKIIVMKLGDVPVKTFTSIFDAGVWLKNNGWEQVWVYNVKRALQKSGLSYGWRWEVRDKSEKLTKLLKTEPSPEQIKEAQIHTRTKISIGRDKLLVMKFGEKVVKTFTSVSSARVWLENNGWEQVSTYNVKRALQKSGLSYGWRWEVRDKSEKLTKLLKTEPSPEQIKEAQIHTRTKISIGRDKLLVMKFGEKVVKTFTSVSSARVWLENNGWEQVSTYNVKQALRKSSLTYGWKWEVQDKSEVLMKLLKAEPSPEQIREAKSHTRKKFSIGSDELLVMKLGEEAVKTFTNVSEAEKWLCTHGWKTPKIERAIRKQQITCGCKWEFQPKIKMLEDLLKTEPDAKQLQVMKSPELKTKSEDVSFEDDSLIASELPVGTLPCTRNTVVRTEPIEDVKICSETAAICGMDSLGDMLLCDAEKDVEMRYFEDPFLDFCY